MLNGFLSIQILTSEKITLFVNGITNYTFKGDGNKKIINIEWGNAPAALVASSRIGINKKEVLYRINAGGSKIHSQDTSEIWLGDSTDISSIFLNTEETNYKINFTTDSISLAPSVPVGTPKEIFQSARTTDHTSTDSLKWEFPVAPGGEVEVRLYFSEMYFNAAKERIFDIEIEDSIKLSDYDIYKDAGKNTGAMKSFTATSDGNININLIRIKQQPQISGIEIICLNEKCNKNNLKFAENTQPGSQKIKAYPNPFNESIKVNVHSTPSVQLDLYNNTGNHLQTMQYELTAGYSDLEINLSNLPVGIYFLKISDKNKTHQTIKLIKQ